MGLGRVDINHVESSPNVRQRSMGPGSFVPRSQCRRAGATEIGIVTRTHPNGSHYDLWDGNTHMSLNSGTITAITQPDAAVPQHPSATPELV